MPGDAGRGSSGPKQNCTPQLFHFFSVFVRPKLKRTVGEKKKNERNNATIGNNGHDELTNGQGRGQFFNFEIEVTPLK